MKEYGVYSQFDLEKHKKRFINYLEVMIDEGGEVHYAIPSHQEWAIERSCKKLGISREELCAMTPEEFYFDWMNWLLMQCGSVAVWNDFYMGKPNSKQLAKLKKLKLEGVYKGSLCLKK